MHILAEQIRTSLFFATPRTKDVERRPCPTNTHTYTLYSSSFHGRRSPEISFMILIPLFFFFYFFFLPLYTNRLRGESSFRPKPLRKPPYEPSRVDIQFYYNFKIIYTDIPLELPKDDQVLLLQGFNDVLSPKGDDEKRFSSTSKNLKNGSPNQKSRCRTYAEVCYSPFNLPRSAKNQFGHNELCHFHLRTH